MSWAKYIFDDKCIECDEQKTNGMKVCKTCKHFNITWDFLDSVFEVVQKNTNDKTRKY